MSEIKYGLLHCHTDNSIRDSVMTVKTLVSQAKKLGAPSVAITDHGVMTGYMEFMQLCREEGMNPIIGVEAYVEEEDEGCRHLIIMAKDYIGFKALIQAVSESNTRIRKISGIVCPRMNKEMLKKHFGPEGKGHGHVIATSACVNGVLAALVTAKAETERQIEKLKKKQKDYESPEYAGFQKNIELLNELKMKKNRLRAEISQYTTESLEEERKAVEYEIERLKQIVQQEQASIAKWNLIQSQIDKAIKKNMTDKELDEILRQEANWYRDNFGRDHFYIELQYHGKREEKKAMVKLAGLSDLTGIPVCISNNAHIPTKTGNDVLARAIIRTTRDDVWKEPTAVDRECYLKTDEELIMKLSEILPREKVMEGYKSIGKIVSECNLEIPVKSRYPIFPTPDGSLEADYLRKMAYEGIGWRYPQGDFHEYERLEHELNVICSMGYADYYCIVGDFMRYARAAGELDLNNPAQKKLALSFDIEKIERFTKNLPGEAVGPGRGSAAGSLVCYLTGITSIDPIEYGLLFERFLNPERSSLPDIDCDMETQVRPYVIRYVKQKYGNDFVCGIMTRGCQTGKAALQTAGRVYGIRKQNDSSAFLKTVDKISKKAVEYAANESHINLNGIRGKLEGVFKGNIPAMEIIHYAVLIEGAMTQIGQHAAGIIITGERPVDQYVPLIYNPNSDMMMTQCDMNQAESFRLLKIDFLGLNNLTIITNALREIYRRTGQVIEISKIPLDDQTVFSSIYGQGKTNSIFQCESQGMARAIKNFRPENISDLILLIAMYRPGPMQYLEDLIAVKQRKRPVRYTIPELEPILKDTYGFVIYQEQVQEIFKRLAGYSSGQADLVRYAMSKKKEEIIKEERQAFIYGDEKRNIVGCIRNNIRESDASTLFDQLTEFSKYAFNKSHAACYAVVSYQTAWLKYYYPQEYMKAVLDHTPFEKIPEIAADLRQVGISIMTPDINRSMYDFCIQEGGILFGLGSIKGIGDQAISIIEERKKHGLYQSMADFILRIQIPQNILEIFIDSGAFDGFCENRMAMHEAVPEYLKQVKKIKGYQKKQMKDQDCKQNRICEQKIIDIRKKIEEIKIDMSICENELECLMAEKQVLGIFASKHPMMLFSDVKSCDAVDVAKVLQYRKNGNITITGFVSDLSVYHRKKDNAEMGFFTLSDQMGEIDVCCFADSFNKAKDILKENAVVKLTGNIMYDESDGGRKKISLSSVELLRPVEQIITVYAKLYLAGIDEEYGELWNLLKPYISRHGNPMRIYDTLMDEFRETDLKLSKAVLEDKRIRSSLHDNM